VSRMRAMDRCGVRDMGSARACQAPRRYATPSHWRLGAPACTEMRMMSVTNGLTAEDGQRNMIAAVSTRAADREARTSCARCGAPIDETRIRYRANYCSARCQKIEQLKRSNAKRVADGTNAERKWRGAAGARCDILLRARSLLCAMCNRYVIGKIERCPGYLERVLTYVGRAGVPIDSPEDSRAPRHRLYVPQDRPGLTFPA
jgi:endogenous inhibitor of DNA gyrase (YacG/DUF329 family)